MDEVLEHEPDKPGLAAGPTITGFSLEESRGGLISGLYFDENLEKGLRSEDASSVLYYGLNCDGGGLHSIASMEAEDAFKDENFNKNPSEDGAVEDLFSAIGLSNASEDYFWFSRDVDYDFTKKFPGLDYQFYEESDSWNSSLLSQSSGSSSKADGVAEQPSQILEYENNQPESLITREVDGNYMTSFVLNGEMGLNSSSYDLQNIGDIKNIAGPVDTSESYHCIDAGYFATSHDHNHMRASCTSLSMQSYDASLVDEGTKAGDPSLQCGSFNMPAYSCVLQDFSEVRPVDTSESYNRSNERHFGTPHDLNNLGARCNNLSMKCSDANLVDENSKSDDPSLLCALINKPVYSCWIQDFSEVSPVDTSESYNLSNVGHFGSSNDLNLVGAGCVTFSVQSKSSGDASLADENSEDDPSSQGFLINQPALSCDLQGFTEVSPMSPSESYPCSNVGYFGASHDASLADENSEDDPSSQGVLINQPALSCDLQGFTEVSPMSPSESYPCSNVGYFGASHDLKHPRPLSTSLSMHCCDANPVVGDAEADDLSPSFQGVLIKKPACSCDPLDGEVKNVAIPVESCGSYHSNQGYFGTAFELNHLWPLGRDLSVHCFDASSEDAYKKADHRTTLSLQCCDASPEDEDRKADHSTCEGVSVNKPADSCDPQDIRQAIIAAGPMETSYNRSHKGYCVSADDLNPLASFTTMFMQHSDASLVDEDKEESDPSFRGFLIGKHADSSDSQDIVASPVDTGESRQHRDEGYVGTSSDPGLNPPGLSPDSIFVRGTDASPMVEDTVAENDTEEDDPTLLSLLIDKRTKCKKVGPHLRRTKMQKSTSRCSDDLPTVKTRCLRRRKDESTNCSKLKHVEAKSQNKHRRKRITDAALVAHNGVTRRSNKQDLDSDDEYDPFHPSVKIRRASRESDGNKNSNLWTLSEVIKLVDGISEFGVGKWTAIQRSSFGSPPYRTSLDIRDKWRNLIKTSGLRLKHIKKEEISPKNGSVALPKSLLERICELDRVQPYLRSGVKRPQTSSHDLLDSSSE